MDEALVPHDKRLRIGRSNFRLLSNIKSKESTLQLIYDVLRLCPFFKAFLVTADVPEIYMQEFWATTTVHHHAIRFKMDNKKHIINLESFKDMLHICPRLHGQSFVEPPFEEEILAFIHFLGHSAVKHKDSKKSNEMYYPRFTKVIIHHFMSKDHSIPRRNKFGALLPIELTNADIKNSNSYKEYYAVATGAAPPKPKASSHDRGTTVKLVTKRSLQQTHISKASGFGADEGTVSIPGVLDVPTDESEEELSQNSTDEEGDDDEGKDGDGDEDDDGDDGVEGDGDDNDEDNDGEEGKDDEQEYDEEEYNEEIRDEESFDLIPKTPENSDNEGNGEEDLGLNRQSSSVSSQFMTSMLNLTLAVGMESIFETTSQMDAQTPTSVAPLPMSAPTLTSSTISTFAGAVFAILGIVHRYMNQRMNEAVHVAVQLQSDKLRKKAQKENDEFLKTIDENKQKSSKSKSKNKSKNKSMYKSPRFCQG
nr:hypothetical protein [Tanacetum cinerariifolium]